MPPKIGVWLETCMALRAAKPDCKLPLPPKGWRREGSRHDHIIDIEYRGETLSLRAACTAAGIPSPTSVRYQVDRWGMDWQSAFNHVIERQRLRERT
jgi:hypothetical protein